jgi:hypothetical protein
MQTRAGRRFVGPVGSAAVVALVLLVHMTTGRHPDADTDEFDGFDVRLGLDEGEALAAGGATQQSPFVSRARRGEVAPPDISELEQLCALTTTCEHLPLPPGLVPENFAACVNSMAQELTGGSAVNYSLTLRECGLSANACEPLKSCALRGAHSDVCQGRGHANAVGFCDTDGRAVTCFHDRIIAVRDCPRADEQCIVRHGQSACILGPCPSEIREGDPAQCSSSGSRILNCDSSKLESTDCGAFGLRCVPTPGDPRPVGCATEGPPCVSGARRCEGNVAVVCYNGHEVKVDCAAGGYVCNGTSGATAVGACFEPPPPGPPCNATDAGTCGGTNNNYINYCFAGRPRSYFCKTLFSGCASDAARGAHCVR